MPVIRSQHREHHRGAAAEDPHPEPGRAQEHLQRAALDELGQAPRGVEEVERVAARRRVEDEQVVAVLGVELEELLHRHVLLRAGERVRELLVDPVGEDAVAGLRVGRVAGGRPRRRSPSRRASSPTARRRRCRSRAARTAPGRPGAPRCRAPAARASRRAASPGRSSAPRPSCPRAAIPAAIAAEVVVLPTPPEPAQMQTRLPSRISATVGHRLRPPRPASRISLDAELGLEDERQRRHGGARPARARRASCSRWRWRAAPR